MGALPVIEEEQANVYFGQKHFKEALSIYERILPEWNPPSEQLNLGPLEEYRRAAICAAELNDWEKAAEFFEDGAKRTQRIEKSERYIGLYADAGFAQFRAGNILESIKLMNSALEEFEMLSQENGDTKCFSLKKRFEETIKRIAKHGSENRSSNLHELPAGFCSDPEPNEEILSLPDAPIGYTWFHLAQVEYRFGHGITVLNRALQIPDWDADPALSLSLSLLQTKHDFRIKTFDDLPHRIHQLASAHELLLKQHQSEKRIGAKSTDSLSITAPSNFASVENIISILGTAFLVRLPTSRDMQGILEIWRANSSELPIKENVTRALDLIESMLSGDLTNAVTVMNTQDAQHENRLAAALKVVYSTRTSLGDLFCAHAFIATSLIGNILEDPVLDDVAELFSSQWLEKIRFRAILKNPTTTVPEIERACKSSERGKEKIGQILIAARQAI